MKDATCVEFLQWALPRLRMRWPGFRKVRRQVCRRIDRRLHELGLADVDAYRAYLEASPEEWRQLDELCHVTISRFYRDRAVFEFLRQTVLPELARAASKRGECLDAWSAGAASGEEPYTLALMWELALKHEFPDVALRVLATDVDETMLSRARAAECAESSLRDLPGSWRQAGFVRLDGTYRLRGTIRSPVTVMRHDVRDEPPAGPFQVVLCRNVAFTYFDAGLQREVADRACDLSRVRRSPGSRRPRDAARGCGRVHAVVTRAQDLPALSSLKEPADIHCSGSLPAPMAGGRPDGTLTMWRFGS